LESFIIIGRVSSEAVLDAKRMSRRSFLGRLMVWLEEVMLEARFFSLKLMLCFMQVRKLLPS
jgi:aarF domain-containing kinase